MKTVTIYTDGKGCQGSLVYAHALAPDGATGRDGKARAAVSVGRALTSQQCRETP